ncbi:hypothetical protein PhCBS80983_g05995 [Powellomyces hirtus]|uniref:Uncharacterized protein n=1 Tax=Powellomyces hirtus TaxID=109895 RepID=A0A507DRB5_9FUNG|nr:hypothetical protein PhCBS80983_g05995 [Powellomyces hirtus]
MWYDQTIDGDYTCVAAHSAFPLIAAATKEGRVELFDDEGHKQEKAEILRVPGDMQLKWHFAKKLLAVSWSNGMVGVWCDHEHVLREGNVHQSPLSVMEWSPSGNRLVTGDEDGDVVVWKVDQRGRIAVLCQYRLSNKVTHCLFRGSEELELKPQSSPPFFLATSVGSIHYADDMGHCTESALVETSIAALLMLEHKDIVVVITTSLILLQFQLTPDGKLTRESQMKLSTAAKRDTKLINAIWAGPATLALSIGGQPIWIWDIENEENYVLNISGTEKARINCISFSNHKNMLVDSGHVVMWKGRFVQTDDEERGRTQVWEVHSKTNVGGSVDEVSWGMQSRLLTVRKPSALKILTEQVMHKRLWGRNAAVQVEQSKVVLYPGGKEPIVRPVELRIKGLALSRNRFAVWNGTSVEIQEYSDSGPPLQSRAANSDPSIAKSDDRMDWFLAAWNDSQSIDSPLTIPAASINTLAMHITIDDLWLYIALGNRVDICNFQGIAKGVVSWTDNEGEVSTVECVSGWLCLTTTKKYLKLISTSNGPPKQVLSKRVDPKLDLHSVISAKPNSQGTMISFSANTLLPGASQLCQIDPKIYVYDVEHDMTLSFDLSLHGGVPISHWWDWEDPRILICQTEGQNGGSEEDPNTVVDSSQILSFFVTSKHGITQYCAHPPPSGVETLLGVYMPFQYYVKKAVSGEPQDLLLSVPAKDQEGLENTDTATLKSMLDFSFHLATGNINESLKSLKHVRNPSTWTTLAKLCIKTRRPDIAALCFANMGNARAVREMERVAGQGDSIAIAMGAMFLGMEAEVEDACRECGRWDLVNRFHQAKNNWEKALHIAATKDRIHLKSTFYNFARWLEEIGDQSGAVAAFEKSGCESFEIPRLLLSSHDAQELEKYIASNSNKALKKWWAQYCESNSDLSTAMQYYEMAGDTLSVARICCLVGQVEKAIDIAQKANSKSALYHIAQHYEAENKISEAISLYSQSTHIRPAIRLAKENKLTTHLTSLALQSSPDCLLDVARYFEARGMGDRAAVLYMKAGAVAKAVDVGLKSGDVEDLVRNLPPDTDPAILQRLSAHYKAKNNPSEALHLLLLAKKFDEALSLIEQHSIPLTEDLIDGIPVTDSAADKQLLTQIADVCMAQQKWSLACKKYTQAGERLKAMQALLKSGDTDKIIFFANVSGSRDRQIYVLASNYLQTLAWRSNPTYLKHIITFYTKAKAWENLASFYESCAGVEVDEFQNYEKALGAMREAAKVVEKIKESDRRVGILGQLESKIALMAQFVQAREAAKTDTIATFQICESLLQTPNIDQTIRQGDIYALLIELHFANGYYPQAQDLLARMQESIPGMNVGYYLDERIVQALRGDTMDAAAGDHVEENISVDAD